MGQVLDARRSSFCFSVSGAAGSDCGPSAAPVAAAPTVLKKSRRFDMLKAYSYQLSAISLGTLRAREPVWGARLGLPGMSHRRGAGLPGAGWGVGLAGELGSFCWRNFW